MAKQSLFYFLNKPLLRDASAQSGLLQWYHRRHIPDLFGLDQSRSRRIYCYRASDVNDIEASARFLTLFPFADAAVSSSRKAGVTEFGERKILEATSPYRQVGANTASFPYFRCLTRNLQVEQLPEGSAISDSDRWEEEEEDLHWVPERQPPERDFNDFQKDYGIDEMDYTTPEDYAPEEDEWAFYEDSSSYSKTTWAPIFDGSIPDDGLPLPQAMDIRSRTYRKIYAKDSVVADVVTAVDPGCLDVPQTSNSILLITQIPHVPRLSIAENDAAFLHHFARYPTLTILPEFQGMVAYQQSDPAYPRWLIIQQYEEEPEGHFLSLREEKTKTMEIRAWWKRQGAPGAIAEFWRLAKVYTKTEDGSIEADN